jgi:hypothetical protein
MHVVCEGYIECVPYCGVFMAFGVTSLYYEIRYRDVQKKLKC